MARDPAEALALWRYHLIAEALDPRLGGRERGLLVRRIAGEHATPAGEPRQVSRNTLDRWIRRYRAEGLAGLRDRPRSDRARRVSIRPCSTRPSACASSTRPERRPHQRDRLRPPRRAHRRAHARGAVPAAGPHPR